MERTASSAAVKLRFPTKMFFMVSPCSFRAQRLAPVRLCYTAHNGLRLCALEFCSTETRGRNRKGAVGPDDAKDAKISGLVNNNSIVARIGPEEAGRSTGRQVRKNRGPGIEGDLVVNVRQREPAIQAIEAADGLEADRFRQQPVAVRLPAEHFDARLPL